MYAHPELQIAYLAHPRTASTATSAALCALPGWLLMGGTGHHDKRLPVVVAEDRESWTVLTTVRNPFDVAVSWAFAQGRPRTERIPWDLETFRNALERNRWFGEGRRLFWHADGADIVLRFERLAQDLAQAVASLGVLGLSAVFAEDPILPMRNVSEGRGGRHYREFYNDETRDYVEQLCAPELEKWGYRYETQE